ncbi:hypothetical protein BKA65DRAFT_599550 [Rhexocercosporidium sp. MPI-PUGE-AT-0058]|nr:hypothetical protein BKA65DRAFT_599550 [Rhexocercosporidium sp. MPI-PUGE-AT-0058]
MVPPMQSEATKEAARRQAEILARLRNDLKNNRLAIIYGAGVTLNVTVDTSGKPLSRITWTGLMRNGLDYLVNEGYVDRSNRRTNRAYEALEDPEIDGLLDAANILSSQMEQQGQFPTWLESVFGSLSQEIRHPDLLDVLKELYERGATLLTTNYDDVLEKYCGLQRVGRSNQDGVSKFQRGDLNGVFHIHGSYCDPHEVVLDTTDYYSVKHSDVVQDVLKTFLQYKTILFVGCGSGLEDPNFDALLKWASVRHENIPHRHCLLIRDDESVKDQPLVKVKYGPRYDDLVVYLKRLLDDQTEVQSPAASHGPGPTGAGKRLELNRDETIIIQKSKIAEINDVSLLDWISLSDQRAQQTAAQNKVGHFHDAGEWIVSEDAFQNWQSCSGSSKPRIWLCGALGTGKTIVTSTVIRHIVRSHRGGLAYFFCSKTSSQGAQDPPSILRSILWQLAGAATHVLKSELRRSGIGVEDQSGCWRFSDTLDEDEVKSFIVVLIKEFQNKTFLVIDALDELEDCEILLLNLEEIERACKGRCRLFVSSRPGPERQFANLDLTWTRIEIEDKTVRDIERYVNRLTQLRLTNKRGMTTDLEAKIRHRLKNGAKGVFWWVELSMDFICNKAFSAVDIGKMLEVLPPTVNEIYLALFKEIGKDQNPANKLLAKRTITWLLGAVVPLSEEAFIEAVCTGSDGTLVNKDRKEILHACHDLVIWIEATKSFGFGHVSVIQYIKAAGDVENENPGRFGGTFSADTFSERSINNRIAADCMHAIDLSMEDRLVYSWSKFTILVKEGEAKVIGSALSIRSDFSRRWRQELLPASRKVRTRAQLYSVPDCLRDNNFLEYHKLHEAAYPISNSARYRYFNTYELHLDQPPRLSRSLIDYSIIFCLFHCGVSQQRGDDKAIKKYFGQGGKALFRKTCGAISLLYDISARKYNSFAISSYTDGAVQRWVDTFSSEKITMEMPIASILSSTSCSCQNLEVKILNHGRKDVAILCPISRTAQCQPTIAVAKYRMPDPFMTACAFNLATTVKNMNDVSISDARWARGLHLAAKYGNEETVKILTVDLTSERALLASKAFLSAADSDNLRAVELLHNVARNINYADERTNSTALHRAANGRAESGIIDFLLDHGAETSHKLHGTDETAFFIFLLRNVNSTAENLERLFSKFCQHKADPKVVDHNGNTPLHLKFSALECSMEMSGLNSENIFLLNKHMRMSLNSELQLPLHVAIQSYLYPGPYYSSSTKSPKYGEIPPDLEIIRQLLNEDQLTMKFSGEIGWPSAHWYCALGYTTAIRDLLISGTNIEACVSMHSRRFSLLAVAALYGQTATVQILIEKDAQVNITQTRPGCHTQVPPLLTAVAGPAYFFKEDYESGRHCPQGLLPFVVSPENALRVVELLLNAGADLNFRDEFGRTIVYNAFRNSSGGKEIGRYLMQRGGTYL